MSSLLSSPSKQASAAASAQGAISQQMIDQVEQYTTQQQQALRGAIGGLGANPYFGASQQINPSMYAINPNDTVSFGSQGPGTYSVPASQPTTPPQAQKPTNPNPKPPSGGSNPPSAPPAPPNPPPSPPQQPGAPRRTLPDDPAGPIGGPIAGPPRVINHPRTGGN
jgi:type II secretory pathway pseudopilin PulG